MGFVYEGLQNEPDTNFVHECVINSVWEISFKVLLKQRIWVDQYYLKNK